MIGFSSVTILIDPPQPLPLAGYSARQSLAEAAHSNLEANILVLFEDDGPICAFVSIDALFVGARLSKAILGAFAAHGLSDECVIFVASHTHFAPALECTKPALGVGDTQHITLIEAKLVAAINKAMCKRPERADVNMGRSRRSFSVNRRRDWPLPQLTRRGLRLERIVMAPNPGGMRDDTITVIVLASESERVVLWHCACHPVGFPNSNQVSSDYPGEIRRRIREIFNNETAVIFLQGFCGDVRPNTPEGPPGLIRRLALGPSFGKFSIDDWNQWAGGIADAVEDAIVHSQAITVGKTTARMSQAPLGELLVGAHQHLCVEFQLVMLFGQIPLIIVSAEPVIELSMLCPVSGALFVGYSRDVFGYWPRTSQLKEGGYEVTGFREHFGVPYPWVSDPDSVFVRMFRQVTAEVGCCAPDCHPSEVRLLW